MTDLFVNFRGEEVCVVIDRNGGHEPDTNAHDIDWHFEDESLRDVELTQEEEEAIYSACLGRLEQGYDDYDY